MPAVVASIVLMGIIFFVSCPFLTMFLFQQRTSMAIRTLKGDAQGGGSYISVVEQSFLDPDSKAAVIKELKTLVADMERGNYENWQSASIMERLQRLPIIQWGELQAIEAFLTKAGDDGEPDSESLLQLNRLRRAIEQGALSSQDIEQVLQPVREPDPSAMTGGRLVQPLTKESVAQVIQLAKLAADRAEIPDQDFEDIEIAMLVRKAIQEGAFGDGY